MKLSVKALALTMGTLWGAAVLLVGTGFVATGTYGRAFMEFLSSIYPGYQATPTWGNVLLGAFYGLVDGAIGGAVFAWVYNRFAK